jgi:hypothetical protein
MARRSFFLGPEIRPARAVRQTHHPTRGALPNKPIKSVTDPADIGQSGHPFGQGEVGMDAGSIASLAIVMAEERNSQAIGIAVLKKALDLQASGAMALIAALPNPTDNLGQVVNTLA